MGCHPERHPERLISMGGRRMEVLVSLIRAMACHLPLEDLAVVMVYLLLLADLVVTVSHSSKCRWVVVKADTRLRLDNSKLRTLQLRVVRLNLNLQHRICPAQAQRQFLILQEV